jgi:acyl-[acyl-carrier-protein]-phospholipid O-acyltransferase/long-chain-fatty-acid--[acyl-carrier-protein] ligase
MSNMIFQSSPTEQTLMEALVRARKIYGRSHTMLEDQNRQPMTYGAFVTKACILSQVIQPHVDQAEKRIGILLPNMVSTALTFFAIQALGRGVAMLNFTAGIQPLKSACTAACVKTVITSKLFVRLSQLTPVIDALESHGVRIMYLEDLVKKRTLWHNFKGMIISLFPTRLLPKRDPQDEAVVLFTSGSEGTPKGVVLTHSNILSNIYQLASRIDFGPQDVVFNCLPMFHSFGLTGGTLLPLLSGIKVFFYPTPLHYRIVPELVYDTNATILFGTDTFLAGYAAQAHPYDFYAIRYVFAGAEKLKEETRQAWFNKFGIRIFEGYGATETAPVLAVNTAMHYGAGTVGRFLPGITYTLQPVPGIQEGAQLVVKGPNIMAGYFKEEAPGLLQPPVDGWYDTGDVVSVDEEGFVRIQGRTKRFAKIGGEMVSLTAVESFLLQAFPGFMHGVVAIPDAKRGEQLVLMTTCPDLTRAQVVQAAQQAKISELMIPRTVVSVKSLPLLGTGKTDYVALKAIALEL